MPRQRQLTQHLLDRAATVWNVIYGTVSFLINFPSHFEAFVKWIDSLDPSQALASSKIGAYAAGSPAEPARAGELSRRVAPPRRAGSRGIIWDYPTASF